MPPPKKPFPKTDDLDNFSDAVNEALKTLGKDSPKDRAFIEGLVADLRKKTDQDYDCGTDSFWPKGN